VGLYRRILWIIYPKVEDPSPSVNDVNDWNVFHTVVCFDLIFAIRSPKSVSVKVPEVLLVGPGWGASL
jgi:hypothetical protein